MKFFGTEKLPETVAEAADQSASTEPGGTPPAARKPAAARKLAGRAKPKGKYTGKRKAPKPTPKKTMAAKATAKAEAPTDLPPTAVIKWIGGDNPAREGSGRRERIAKLMRFDGKTVEAFLKAGGVAATLRNSIRLGLAALK